MSDATRAVALTEATKLGLGTSELTLEAAKEYNDFLTADSTPAAAPAAKPAATKVVTSAKTATAAKPATTAKKPATKPAVTEDAAAAEGLEAAAAADAEADAEAETVDDDAEIPVSKEGVQAVIAKLLSNNLRAEAIKLLKKFNAASATSVKEKDYAKFIETGVALLPAAESEEDLTA